LRPSYSRSPPTGSSRTGRSGAFAPRLPGSSTLIHTTISIGEGRIANDAQSALSLHTRNSPIATRHCPLTAQTLRTSRQ
jgi:hypothetical protein